MSGIDQYLLRYVCAFLVLGVAILLAVHWAGKPSREPSTPQCLGTLYYRPSNTTQPLRCADAVTPEALEQGITLVCLGDEMRQRFNAPVCASVSTEKGP
jgi:hypothetical protein